MKFKRLKDLREDSDWTQQQLTDRLAISRSAYSAYENGANAPPIEVLLRLAEIYHTSVDYILGRTDTRLPYPPSRYHYPQK